MAAPALSGMTDVSIVEDAAVPTSWLVVLNVSLSVCATAALMWTVGLTLVLGIVLPFWTALGGLGLALWWRKKRTAGIDALQEGAAEDNYRPSHRTAALDAI